MEPILTLISKGKRLVADGAIGSLLMERAGDMIKGACPEALNLSKPEILTEIAKLYLDAGAQIIQTNTFGGSPLKLADSRLDGDITAINEAAVTAVKQVTGDSAYVSASCGPSGKMFKPFGSVSHEEMFDNFIRQIEVLVGAGADIICVETMTDIEEAKIAVRAAREISSSIPVIATMTFDEKPRGFYTMMGVSIEQAARELEQAGADIVGSNCGNGIEKMILIAREFRKQTSLPLIIQSNAGLPVQGPAGIEYPETPEFMAEKSRELIDAGVSIIGGCCGTTPEHIRHIAKVVGDPALLHAASGTVNRVGTSG
jgi:5-methyltetrahydrofolate--homocysteine methyltransferase